MDDAVRAWLLAQLGPTTDVTDLEARYNRLRSARQVAAEVLAERRAKLLADPLRVSVPGAVTLDHSANLAGLERQMAGLDLLIAPDDVKVGVEGLPALVAVPLVPARRWR